MLTGYRPFHNEVNDNRGGLYVDSGFNVNAMASWLLSRWVNNIIFGFDMSR